MNTARPVKRACFLLVATSAIALSPCLGTAWAQKHGKRLEREQVEALEAQWKQAQLANDIPGMDKLLSDDYLGINSLGEVVTKAQQLDHMRSRTFTLTRFDNTDVKIKLIGNRVAVVTSLAQVTGSTDGHPLDGSFRYTRVYQHLPGGPWKITSFEATHLPGSHAPQPD